MSSLLSFDCLLFVFYYVVHFDFSAAMNLTNKMQGFWQCLSISQGHTSALSFMCVIPVKMIYTHGEVIHI